jgi:hypothetical protein
MKITNAATGEEIEFDVKHLKEMPLMVATVYLENDADIARFVDATLKNFVVKELRINNMGRFGYEISVYYIEQTATK